VLYIRSTIGYLSNSWPSSFVFCCELVFITETTTPETWLTTQQSPEEQTSTRAGKDQGKLMMQ